jgi:chromosomal replication initiator protein
MNAITSSDFVSAINVLVWYNGYLEDIIREQSKFVTMNDTQEIIISSVLRYFDESREDVFSKRRTADLVLPRQTIMYLLRKHLNCTYANIGRMFGKDHSTVVHSIQVIEELLSYDRSYRAVFRAICSELQLRIGEPIGKN